MIRISGLSNISKSILSYNQAEYTVDDLFNMNKCVRVYAINSALDLPKTPEFDGDIYYLTNEKRLLKYCQNKWSEIEWYDIVKETREWQQNRLRINSTTGALEISHDGSTWNECIPLVGAQTYRIMTFDNTNYTQKYFLMPGNSVILNGLNHVPIAYAKDVFPMYDIQYYWTYAYEGPLGLRPNNTAISDGDGQWLVGSGTNIDAGRNTSLTIIPLWQTSNTSNNWGFGRLSITSSKWFFNGMNQSLGGFEVSISNCSGTPASGSWWMGTWRNDNGAQFMADHVFIRRLR